MVKYLLLTGTHSGIDVKGERKLYKEGDIVELNDDQAAAFNDKFKAISVAKAEAAEIERKNKEAEAKVAKAVAEDEAEQEAARKAVDADTESKELTAAKVSQNTKSTQDKKI